MINVILYTLYLMTVRLSIHSQEEMIGPILASFLYFLSFYCHKNLERHRSVGLFIC